MFRNPAFSIALASIYLVGYVTVLNSGISLQLMLLLFSVSPILLLWMVYTILKYGRYAGPSLGPDREWGYQDRRSEDLGAF
ncbi:MAG TPA: hypothetical protein VGD92_09910 [Sphingobacteriaceae bacterium]